MKRIKKSISEKVKNMLFGTPIRGQKAYPTTTLFKTTYPEDYPEYNDWCQRMNFSSAVVKKSNK